VISQIRNKDEFQKIFAEYYAPLCNFVLRFVKDYAISEDIVQSTFIRIWEQRQKITLTGSLKSYLFSATRNQAIDYLRKVKREEQTLQQSLEAAQHFDEVKIEQEADSLMIRKKLLLAINELKPKMREIFTLHKIEGLTYKEISEHLGIPQRTIEYNIYAALVRLKEILKDKIETY
jgi:RNA polymerase sigma-70 factor (ECF subfamily)